MFKSFIAWLDSYLSREEPSSVLKAIIGLMAFAGLLGTVFGNQAVRAGAFVVAFLFVASAILVLLTDRRRLRHELEACETDRTLLARYCDFLIEQSAEPALSIEHWRQVLFIEPSGDVKEVLTLRAVALRENLPFIRLTAGSRWNQPTRQRNNVKVTARGLATNGAPGPRWRVTSFWPPEKMVSILHLPQPLKRGMETHFELTREWPAKCLPLMREREVETFSIATTRFLEIQQIEYRIVLPVGFDATYEPYGETDPGVHLTTEAESDPEGRRVFVWRSGTVPARTAVGIRLELK
jgi:hypothetical protein